MLKEDKKIWTDALRSGEFEQGRDELYCNGKSCCLDVAGIVLGPKYGFNSRTEYRDPEGDELLTVDFLHKINLSTWSQEKLTMMNDGNLEFEYDETKEKYVNHVVGQKPFSEIADWIDENL